VEIRTDPDNAGDRMAEQINATLGSRCEVVRVRPRDVRP
jgi:5S rRNA maturation endonuclease (ribonuclease M5)